MSDTTRPIMIKDQPPPKLGTGDLWLDVIADMQERRRLGIERYGTPLQSGNGRDALVDAYQEALDLCVYLRQAIAERTPSKHCMVAHAQAVRLNTPEVREAIAELDYYVVRAPEHDREAAKANFNGQWIQEKDND